MKNSLNKFYILFLLLITHTIYAEASERKYVLLNGKNDIGEDIRSHYLLNTKKLYKVDYNVEIYNFLFPGNEDRNKNLFLFSVLPDLITGRGWEEIKDQNIIKNLLDIETLKEELFVPSFITSGSEYGNPQKFFGEYLAVKKSGEKYFYAPNTLLEKFTIVSFENIFPSVYGYLNLNQPKVELKEYLELFKKSFPNEVLPFEFDKKVVAPSYRFGWRLWKEYLSKEVKTSAGTAYQFWTIGSSNGADYYDWTKGINRFLYLPTKGIIGGSYDFYFRDYVGNGYELIRQKKPLNKLSDAEWNQNILEEKIMTVDPSKL
ncbi:hypothetical protein GCM10009120_04510 [Sphingobacterium siyangense subsp. cladoniae]|uniref:hypothetical protein n=1 Tax=Sphingobacterium siyangense TaxID=459529 RepID=UPI0031FA42BB